MGQPAGAGGGASEAGARSALWAPAVGVVLRLWGWQPPWERGGGLRKALESEEVRVPLWAPGMLSAPSAEGPPAGTLGEGRQTEKVQGGCCLGATGEHHPLASGMRPPHP